MKLRGKTPTPGQISRIRLVDASEDDAPTVTGGASKAASATEVNSLAIENPLPSVRVRGQQVSERPAVAAAIKKAREGAGLTQYQLADLVGLSYSGIALWETGRNNPEIQNLRLVALACRVPLSDLLTDYVPGGLAGETEAVALVRIFLGAGSAGKRVIMQAAKSVAASLI